MLALALATGTAVLALSAAPSAAKEKEQSGQAKITLSPKFQPVYIDFAKKLDADKARPDVIAAQAKGKAATDEATQKAAMAELAGLLAAEKAQLATVAAAAVTPDDHLVFGSSNCSSAGSRSTAASSARGSWT